MSNPAARSVARKRRFRQRQKAGAVVLRIEVCEHALAEAMIVSGRMSETAALSRDATEREVSRIIGEWMAHWSQRKRDASLR
jgi:hypothetical protein